MADILTITDLILSHADSISSFLMVVALLVAFIIAMAEYKHKLWEYITNRRNKWWFVYLLVTLFGILFFRDHSWLSNGWLIIVSVIWVLYAVACLCSLKPKRFINYSNPVLKTYEKRLGDGCSIEYIEYFRHRHWYLFSAEDKLEFHMLACHFFDDVKDFESGYKELEKIKSEWLYEGEKRIINLQRAMLLVQMGSMKAAFQLLGDPEDNKSGDPMVWFAYSYIFENAGDIDKAFIYAEKSRGIVDAGYKAPDFVLASVYNNYSHVAVIKGNRHEVLHYLDVAWSKVKKSHDMRTIHLIASNRITQMAMAGTSREVCEAALKEYKELIPNDSFANKVEYNNCAISYYRQIKDAQKEYELIKSGFQEVIDHLDYNQNVLYTASTFRMLMNGHYEHNWLDKFVKSGLKEYDSLPLVDKLVVFEEYMGIFQQEEFRAVCNKRPYMGLQKKILKYYRDQAIREIDEAIVTVEPYNCFLYMRLTAMKLGILKLNEGTKHIDKSKGLYIDLYHQLYDAGLHLDAAQVLMTLVDECSSAYNILIQHPLWPRAIYYSDYIAGSPPVPDPLLEPDGIHLQYYRLQIPNLLIVKPQHDDVIQEHIDELIAEFHSWKNHPYKVNLSIGIARILMCLDRKQEAMEFLRFFKESGVSDMQMASWVRDTIKALDAELSQH